MLIIINHEKKLIIPVDLKTSSKPEWEFYKSFIDWSYDIQARLYWRIIRDNIDRNPYFKDFKLANYRFVVVNKNTLTPLVWQWEFTQQKGLVEIGTTVFEDPEDIGKDLSVYLESKPPVPIGININEINSLTTWLSK